MDNLLASQSGAILIASAFPRLLDRSSLAPSAKHCAASPVSLQAQSVAARLLRPLATRIGAPNTSSKTPGGRKS